MLPSPLGLPALALLASTGDPGQNTRTSTPRAGLAAYYACAGPPLLTNRSTLGEAGRAYAAVLKAWAAIRARESWGGAEGVAAGRWPTPSCIVQQHAAVPAFLANWQN